MYEVPADLPIQAFVGHELNQICLGRFQIPLHFSGVGSISVEGGWELRDAAADIVDRAEAHETRKSYRIHRLIDIAVARCSVDPPRSFTLFFDIAPTASVVPATNVRHATKTSVQRSGIGSAARRRTRWRAPSSSRVSPRAHAEAPRTRKR